MYLVSKSLSENPKEMPICFSKIKTIPLAVYWTTTDTVLKWYAINQNIQNQTNKMSDNNILCIFYFL